MNRNITIIKKRYIFESLFENNLNIYILSNIYKILFMRNRADQITTIITKTINATIAIMHLLTVWYRKGVYVSVITRNTSSINSQLIL